MGMMRAGLTNEAYDRTYCCMSNQLNWLNQ